jgi:exoribonuclease-2
VSLDTDSAVIPQDSLVLYKKRPARVVRTGESTAGAIRLEIELEGGNLAKVRSKDLILLHPGPLESLSQLEPQVGEVELAWQILSESQGSPRRLAELAEIIYGRYTPATTWAAWQCVEDGLYFRGSPDAIVARSPDEVSHQLVVRQMRTEEAQARAEFLNRARSSLFSMPEDKRFLSEAEGLALGRKKDCRLLRELGRNERPENAYALLLESGYWTYSVDPYPSRLGLSTSNPEAPIQKIIEEPRLDLTDIPAYAIDDQQNQDPDDAISLVSCTLDERGNFLGGFIWVHIADVAALVYPNSEADLEARSRGATLYLPERTIPMLPFTVVQSLGLGLSEISPALSFGIELNALGEIVSMDVKTSQVRVQRLNYEEAEECMRHEPFNLLYQITERYCDRRRLNRALFIDLPEVNLRVSNEKVFIIPIQKLKSRDLVREAMLMVGEAVARFAIEKDIPIPFVTQEAPTLPEKETWTDSVNLASHFAIRRNLKRSQISSIASPHVGVGLPVYTRSTSPLRRYLDLVVHQQLRAYLHNQPLFDDQEILERVGTSEAVTGLVSQAESLARRHWTLVCLMQNPGWRGEGILVEKEGFRGTVIIPELALESPIHLRVDLPLNSQIPLKLSGINLPELDVHFTHLV